MHAQTSLSQLRILVVDDDDLMLHQIELTLTNIGVGSIKLLTDGRSALQKISDGESYDIIILDLNMPEMDGIEVMRNLAARNYQGPIALFSGEDIRILKTANSLASAHNLNLLGSLTKPVTVDSINLILQSYYSHKQIIKNVAEQVVDTEVLKRAIQHNQIVPFFQPKVEVKHQKIASAEVLARWPQHDSSMLSPINFIPVAEEHDLIDELTYSIFTQSMNYFGRWLKQGSQFTLGVNLSANNLNHVDLPETLAKIANAAGVPCNMVELEVTESRLMKNLTTSLDVLTRLRLKGFGLSIDDFGTGYSSMAQLNQIPFTELKIDRAFVHGVHQDADAYAILESSAALARKLEMTIVAEGVEDQDDWDSATQVGCDLIQGYFIAKAMSASEFELWINSNNVKC